MKKFLSTLLALCLTLSLCMQPVSAASDMKYEELDVSDASNFTDEDFFISDEVAACIAELFIADMVETGLTAWDEDTAVVATVPMYDATGENVTAYSVEATEGYVVVSAYLDVPDIIFEWSDETAPLYSKFATNVPYLQQGKSGAKIVYLGALGYFYDDGGECLLSISETKVWKDLVSNSLAGLRSLDNVSEEMREQILAENHQGAGVSPMYISDPFTYAKWKYGGSWRCNDYRNYWEKWIAGSPLTQNALSSNYPNACGPIAITNILKTMGNRYSQKNSAGINDPKAVTLNGKSYKTIFEEIEDLSFMGLYYYNPVSGADGGVLCGNLGDYAKKAFSKYGLSVAVSDLKKITWVEAINTCKLDHNFMLIYLDGGDLGNPYGSPGSSDILGHIVVGYAYTRLVSDSNSESKTFIKIMDGDSTGGRYLLSNLIETSVYHQITYTGRAAN